jgi:hypothetical protein
LVTGGPLVENICDALPCAMIDLPNIIMNDETNTAFRIELEPTTFA